MDFRVPDSASNRRLEIQIKAAVRVAHVMMNAEQSDAELLMLVLASRHLEDDKEMQQAMALAVCAAQKSKAPA